MTRYTMQLPNWNALFNLIGVQITLSPFVLACALIAAAGALLVVNGLGLLSDLPLWRGQDVDLEQESNRINGVTAFGGSSIGRVIAPLVQEVMMRSGEPERIWAERAYDLLDRRKTSSDYYLHKVLGGIAGFAGGVTLGLIPAASGFLLPLLIVPLCLSVVGYLWPQMALKRALAQRAEQIVFEVPYVLDQLSVNLLAHNEDLITALQVMLKRPEGGYLVREFLQVVTDNAKSGQIGQALKRMAERNSDVPVVVRIAELLAHSLNGSMGLTGALQEIGDRAMDDLESLIRRRGEENGQAMVAPSAIALIGIMLALLGPALIELMRFLG